MCGITGVYGSYAPLKAMMMTLNQLERGVQGCGVAYMCNGSIKVVKAPVHPVRFIEDYVDDVSVDSWFAIGHNRLPSQGEVCYENTHPFVSCGGEFALAHNGHAFITSMRGWLVDSGHRIDGETDSEVLTHVLCELYGESGDMLQALRELTVNYLSGTVAVIDRDGVMYFAKSGANPLYYAIVEGEVYVASTVKAIRSLAHELRVRGLDVIAVDHGEVVKVEDGYVDHLEISKHRVKPRWRGGYMDQDMYFNMW